VSRSTAWLTAASIALGLLLLPSVGLCQEEAVRFQPLDIYLDSPERPLAAYQLELVVEAGDAKIVGVEGGEHPAFKAAPTYDPGALHGGRIILAAFSTAEDLPRGRSRMLTVHVREAGPAPRYALRLVVAAAANGEKLTPAVSLETRKGGR